MKTTITTSKGEDLRAIHLTATSVEVARDEKLRGVAGEIVR